MLRKKKYIVSPYGEGMRASVVVSARTKAGARRIARGYLQEERLIVERYV